MTRRSIRLLAVCHLKLIERIKVALIVMRKTQENKYPGHRADIIVAALSPAQDAFEAVDQFAGITA